MSEREGLQDRIRDSYEVITKPWTSIGEESPAIGVLELSRKLDLDVSVVAKSILNNDVLLSSNGSQSKLLLVEPNGTVVEDIDSAARNIAPYKRAVQKADYRSRAPGGGPVVKRRIEQPSLGANLKKLGIGRLKVATENVETSAKEREREEVKSRLSLRWQTKAGIRSSNQQEKEVKEEAVKKANSFMSFVASVSVMSPERPNRIKDLVAQAASDSGEVMFINWICPPGTPLECDPETGKLYRLFANKSPREGFENDYRLYPRIDLERRLVKQIEKIGSNKVTYIKGVADDNPYCLYPASIRLEGEDTTLSSIANYSSYVQERMNQLVGKDAIWVMRWSELLGSDLFQEFIYRFKNTKFEDLEPYLPSNILDIEMDVLAKHTNPDPSLLPAFRQFAKDVVVQYNVEMDILYDLFGDNVVLAWNESTRRGAMLDALRKLKGRPPIPKMYALHRKENEVIVNNF